ncbi:hypothetical protein L2E82_22044 [Cichorium intybus]|uniref:Uncharacterized protein n=1 Tax=Cichorium intybus TaxID=13427 RepID=A0ACB9DXH9_CICIN|nr:hypothetical protein L2E82_22044 [Cichorium intybus]
MRGDIGGFLGGGDGTFGGDFHEFNWDESSPSSMDSTFDFVYEALTRFVLSNCLHFALKRVLVDFVYETLLLQFLESKSEAISAMKTVLEEKLEAGEDEESLKILKKLVSAQLENLDWKFLMAGLLNEMGDIESARVALEEILTQNPLSFEALFENTLLMDSCGQGGGSDQEIRKSFGDRRRGKEGERSKGCKIDNCSSSISTDDFRPHFCKGMIYSLMDKNDEAKVHFAKYRELSPKKFEVEGYL